MAVQNNENRTVSATSIEAKVYSSAKHGTYQDGYDSIDPSEIELAFSHSWGDPIKYYDDGQGCLWVLIQSLNNVVGIVRARDESDAWELFDDEILEPISNEDYEQLMIDHPDVRHAGGDLPDGYQWQSNFNPGTCGIVEHDINGEVLQRLTAELIMEHNIKVEIVL